MDVTYYAYRYYFYSQCHCTVASGSRTSITDYNQHCINIRHRRMRTSRRIRNDDTYGIPSYRTNRRVVNEGVRRPIHHRNLHHDRGNYRDEFLVADRVTRSFVRSECRGGAFGGLTFLGR